MPTPTKAELWTEISRLLVAYDSAESEDEREALAKRWEEVRQRLSGENPPATEAPP
jgi:hypothetical protein